MRYPLLKMAIILNLMISCALEAVAVALMKTYPVTSQQFMGVGIMVFVVSFLFIIFLCIALEDDVEALEKDLKSKSLPCKGDSHDEI